MIVDLSYNIYNMLILSLKVVYVLQIKANYYNPIAKHNINIIVNYRYKLIPKPLNEFGKCVKLDCHKEVMPYGVYTYEHVSLGACSIQSALDMLKDDDAKNTIVR